MFHMSQSERMCACIDQNADTVVTDKLSFLLCLGVYCSYLLAEAERNLKPSELGSLLLSFSIFRKQSSSG